MSMIPRARGGRTKTHEGFELLKDKKFRRNITSSFNASSRNAWQDAHASKTNPPDVGKYKPKFNQIWAPINAPVMRETPPNDGIIRKERKEEQ